MGDQSAPIMVDMLRKDERDNEIVTILCVRADNG